MHRSAREIESIIQYRHLQEDYFNLYIDHYQR